MRIAVQPQLHPSPPAKTLSSNKITTSRLREKTSGKEKVTERLHYDLGSVYLRGLKLKGQTLIGLLWVLVRDAHSPNEHAIAVPTIPPPDIMMSKSSFSEVLESWSNSEDEKSLCTAPAPLRVLTATHWRPIPTTASLALARDNILVYCG